MAHLPLSTDPNRKIGSWEPRYNLDNIPCLLVGMGEDAAFKSGYRHGWEGLNTRSINCLTINTPEHAAWERGYTEGENDRAMALSDVEDHEHMWGPLERSHLAGTVHRKCRVPGCKFINALDDDDE